MPAAKKAEGASSNTLLAALNYAKSAFLEEGEVWQRHVLLKDKMLYAYNGIIGVGVPIEEQLTAYPEGHTLRAALGRCQGPFSLAMGRDSLRIVSGPFRASVPCLSMGLARAFMPDPAQGPVGNVLKEAFAALLPLVNETGATIMESCLSLDNGFASATNRRVVAQYWHGIPFPNRLLLPRQAIDAVRMAPSDLVSFGYSSVSATFHFADNSWLKTNLLHDERYPDMNRLFVDDCSFEGLPTGFADAAQAVAAFDEKGLLHYGPEGLSVGKGAKSAAVLIEPVINKPVAFYFNDWQTLAKRAKAADWLSDPKAVHFVGHDFRAVLQKYIIHTEDNIPF